MSFIVIQPEKLKEPEQGKHYKMKIIYFSNNEFAFETYDSALTFSKAYFGSKVILKSHFETYMNGSDMLYKTGLAWYQHQQNLIKRGV